MDCTDLPQGGEEKGCRMAVRRGQLTAVQQ